MTILFHISLCYRLFLVRFSVNNGSFKKALAIMAVYVTGRLALWAKTILSEMKHNIAIRNKLIQKYRAVKINIIHLVLSFSAKFAIWDHPHI